MVNRIKRAVKSIKSIAGIKDSLIIEKYRKKLDKLKKQVGGI